MFVTINRPPNDTFTFRLFFNLAKQFQHPDWFYIWSSTLEAPKDKDWWADELKYRNTLFDYINSDTVVLGLKDHLTPTTGFNPWIENMPGIASYISDLTKFYSNKNFIIFTSLEKLDHYLDSPNSHIVPWGGDITNQMIQYPKIQPVLDKNFDSDRSFVSLNRNPRFHRAIAIYIMLAFDLDKKGYISCLFKDTLHYQNDIHNWIISEEIKKLINVGIDKINSAQFLSKDTVEIYSKNHPNDNVFNFETKLRTYYQDSFIEFVNETSFTEQCFLITEKTLNSIYGCNFPIWLSSKGTVRFLRDFGLDTFDDVIDHSYDDINDPTERLFRAISDNRSLIENLDKVKDLWVKNKKRFIDNVDFAKSTLYTRYANRAETRFHEVINRI